MGRQAGPDKAATDGARDGDSDESGQGVKMCWRMDEVKESSALLKVVPPLKAPLICRS